jgi:glycosyltransferase involved in cell wall biosynthesis
MPNAFIEALHYGLPCLAYDNTVFPEYLDMGFHVTLAADRDTADLSAKLLFMTNNIEQEKRDAEINSRLAREYFNVERELDSWRTILV